MMRISKYIAPVAVAALALGTTQADAGRVDLDVNAINVNANGSFDSDFTGTLQISGRPETQLVSIFVNGEDQLFSEQDASVNGFIDLSTGTVTGGFLKLVVLDSNDTYTAEIRDNSGNVVQAINSSGLFQLGGLTFDGEFTDANGDGLFAGVDLEDIPFDQDLPGNFLVLDYEPNENGQDVADIEFRAVPLPSAALLGAPLVLGVPVLRRTIKRLRG